MNSMPQRGDNSFDEEVVPLQLHDQFNPDSGQFGGHPDYPQGQYMGQQPDMRSPISSDYTMQQPIHTQNQ